MDTEDQQVEIDEAIAQGAPPEEVDNGDGTVTVALDQEEVVGKPKTEGWFDNLATEFSDILLDKLAERYLDLIDRDLEARKDRDKQQAAALLKAGLGGPAPGGADFNGASRATHPVLIEAYIDFSASCIRELFPPNGPVKTKIEGKPNKEKLERAKRKADFMNWQLTNQVKSFRPELERLLTQLPPGGTQFFKLYNDESSNRPDAEFVPIDDFILPYDARNFHVSQRKFHRMKVNDLTYERRIKSGVYVDHELPPGSGARLDQTESEKQSEKIEGKRNDYSTEDGERIIYEGVVYETIDADTKAPEGKLVPYIITIEEESRKVLAIYRDWEEDDRECLEIDYIVDFNFIPWRGAYGLSLEQCLAGLPDALTGALRALLDAALINNMPSGFKLKGRPGGQSDSVSPTEIKEIDGGGETDDIRKLYMPLPFNPPSTVLYQLLGFLTDAAKGIVATSEEKIAEASNQMPMGTALALIEQGAKVFSAIHARQHDSLRRVLEILHRINAKNLPEKVQYGSDPEDFVLRSDFEGPMDVHPVSDPNIFSETQRFAQIQFVFDSIIKLASIPNVTQTVMGLFKLRALYARMYEMAKIPEYEEFLPELPEALPLNPADENVNLVMGKPVKAFPGQNHLAHIQVLLDFAKNPMFGASPIIAPKFLPGAMNHLMDHMLVWYEEMMKTDAARTIGSDAAQIDWDNDPQSSIELAKAAPVVDKAAEVAFAQIPKLVQQGMKMLQAMQPKPPLDPMAQVAMVDVQNKNEIAKGKLSLEQQKLLGDLQDKKQAAQQAFLEAQQKAQQADRDYESEMQKLGLDAHVELTKAGIQASTDIRTQNMQNQTEMAKTIHDNETAKEIAEAKIESDEKTKLSTGATLSESRK